MRPRIEHFWLSGWGGEQALTLELADTLAVADALAIEVSVALSDAVVVADATTAAPEAALFDSLAVVDSTAVEFGAALADSLSVSDVTTASPEIALSDAVGVADATTAETGIAHELSLADTLVVSDTIATELAEAPPPEPEVELQPAGGAPLPPWPDLVHHELAISDAVPVSDAIEVRRYPATGSPLRVRVSARTRRPQRDPHHIPIYRRSRPQTARPTRRPAEDDGAVIALLAGMGEL